jgi:hypothetical protein
MLHNVNQLASSHVLATLGVKLPFPCISSPTQTVTAADYFDGMKGKSRALQQQEQEQQLEQQPQQPQQPQQQQQQQQQQPMTADQKASAASRKRSAFEKQLQKALPTQDTMQISALQQKIEAATAECLQAQQQAAEERHAAGRAPIRKASEGIQQAVASTMPTRKRKEVCCPYSHVWCLGYCSTACACIPVLMLQMICSCADLLPFCYCRWLRTQSSHQLPGPLLAALQGREQRRCYFLPILSTHSTCRIRCMCSCLTD